jgi:hypothetical protein
MDLLGQPAGRAKGRLLIYISRFRSPDLAGFSILIKPPPPFNWRILVLIEEYLRALVMGTIEEMPGQEVFNSFHVILTYLYPSPFVHL